MKPYRINGFDQIKAFYSWVFNNADKRVTPQHISLYLFLINQANRNNWVEWFKVPYDLGMTGACIGNKKTYYSCLGDLTEWHLIEYQKGVNEWKAPLIKLEVLNSTTNDTATVPLPEPLLIPQVIPLPTPLPTHIYKLLTNNLKLITDNIEEIINFLEGKEKPARKKVFDFADSLIDLGVEKNIVADWLQVRKAKKAANTETAFKGIEKEILISGASANDCIRMAVENSWQGFKAEWYKNKRQVLKPVMP